MNSFVGFWLIINAIVCYLIVIFSFIDSEAYKSDRLFFPKVIRGLREELSITGTIIATIIITVLFLPALLLYFMVISLIGILILLIKLFGIIFKRRD